MILAHWGKIFCILHSEFYTGESNLQSKILNHKWGNKGRKGHKGPKGALVKEGCGCLMDGIDDMDSIAGNLEHFGLFSRLCPLIIRVLVIYILVI
jgi:hypothetical protein